MKIIDLLNKIANGEEVPEKIKLENHIWEYDYEYEDYYCGELNSFLMDRYNMMRCLNYEVEIIEDNKIEKINYDKDTTNEWSFGEVYDKINELIDEVNKLKENK